VRPSERLTVVAALALLAITVTVRPGGASLRAVVFLSIAVTTVLLARAPIRRDLQFLRG